MSDSVFCYLGQNNSFCASARHYLMLNCFVIAHLITPKMESVPPNKTRKLSLPQKSTPVLSNCSPVCLFLLLMSNCSWLLSFFSCSWAIWQFTVNQSALFWKLWPIVPVCSFCSWSIGPHCSPTNLKNNEKEAIACCPSGNCSWLPFSLIFSVANEQFGVSLFMNWCIFSKEAIILALNSEKENSACLWAKRATTAHLQNFQKWNCKNGLAQGQCQNMCQLWCICGTQEETIILLHLHLCFANIKHLQSSTLLCIFWIANQCQTPHKHNIWPKNSFWNLALCKADLTHCGNDAVALQMNKTENASNKGNYNVQCFIHSFATDSMHTILVAFFNLEWWVLAFTYWDFANNFAWSAMNFWNVVAFEPCLMWTMQMNATMAKIGISQSNKKLTDLFNGRHESAWR